MPKEIFPNQNQESCCESDCGCHDSIEKESGCCCESTDECPDCQDIKTLNIELLYLDLSVCSRCQNTESTLVKSIEAVKDLFTSAGYEVILKRIHIDSIDKAIRHRFMSSPTIRLNGRDIISQLDESSCKDCGDICGNDVDCRDWIYEGVRYTEPPQAMIIRAILKEIYFPTHDQVEDVSYQVPDNLKTYFG